MKLVKLMLSIGLIIILAFINSAYAENENIKNEELFLKAFKESGAEFYELNLNFNGKISVSKNNEYKIEKMLEQIVEELEIIDSDLNNKIENNNFQKVIKGLDKDQNLITVIINSYVDEERNTEEINLIIDIINNKNYLEKEEITRKVLNLYNNYNIEAEISYCIIGTFKAELSKDQIFKKIIKTLAIIDGKKVEGLIDEDIISISAFSPNIDRFIYTGNKKMNFNIAMSYNEYKGKTYIIMGCPIITIVY